MVKCSAPDPPTATRLPGHEREKLNENEWGSGGSEEGQACSGIPRLRPSLWARDGILQESLHELRHLEPPPLLTGSASCRSTESVNRMQSCFYYFYYFISFFILFLPAFFNIVYILCIIAFGASSFYSFLYQKCTTLYHLLNYWNAVCFRWVSFEEKDTHCALFFTWSVWGVFFQDDEIARSIHHDCDAARGFWRSSLSAQRCHKYATCSSWTPGAGCLLYSVVSSLHVHTLLLMDFLNIEAKHWFERVYQMLNIQFYRLKGHRVVLEKKFKRRV